MTTQQDERAELIRWLNEQASLECDEYGPLHAGRMMQKAAALLAADARGGEAVRYEYRWLNPANNPGDQTEAMKWKLVELRNPHTDTMQSRVRELEAYRYNGKPVYEVRALYTRPQQAALVALTDEQIELMRGDRGESSYMWRCAYEVGIRDAEAAHKIGRAVRTCGACGMPECVAGECSTVGINGLTEAETAASASVIGISRKDQG